ILTKVQCDEVEERFEEVTRAEVAVAVFAEFVGRQRPCLGDPVLRVLIREGKVGAAFQVAELTELPREACLRGFAPAILPGLDARKGIVELRLLAGKLQLVLLLAIPSYTALAGAHPARFPASPHAVAD